MKRLSLVCLMMLALTLPAMGQAVESATVKVPVDSPAFVFSPGNWTGDDGRAGSQFRQTWYPYAYFRVTFKSATRTPTAKILMDASMYPEKLTHPKIAYSIDGAWTSQIAAAAEIPVENLKGDGQHELCVVFCWSRQEQRWGRPGKSGLNVVRVTGVALDAKSEPVATKRNDKWALIVGDSITEGCGARELCAYSHLLGQSLLVQGYEYGNSACGWSGWINTGDVYHDVPGYYVITGSENGQGGEYHDDKSRWNKIDGNNHSLLDASGRISAYGGTGQEPSLIFINYGTNDILHRSNKSDTFASMIQGLAALRKAAPDAQIVVLIPFGQFYAQKLYEAVEIHKRNHPDDKRISVIDLGPQAKKAINVKKGIYGGLHPNDRGCANFAAQIIPQVTRILIKNEKE